MVEEDLIEEQNTLLFTFAFPDASSPFEHELGIDTRALGISLSGVLIE